MSTMQTKAYTCPWCGQQTDPHALSCVYCGASVDVTLVTSRSGWTKLPPRRDMAKLQFGQSYCQIEGTYVPVADFNLSAEDKVYFAHHVLLWKDTQTLIDVMPLKGAFKRLLSGMPLIMTEAGGPGHIALSRDTPGELVALPLQPGQSIDVREHLFMVATKTVAFDWFNPNVWFDSKDGDETERHYPVGMLMDRFSAADKPGLLLLHSAGNVFTRELASGESILIKPTSFIFKDTGVSMNLHFEHPAAKFSLWGNWGNRYLWLRLQGPGRVAVQSVFEHIEGEQSRIVAYSNATKRQW